MTLYILKRVLVAVLTVFLVAAITFFLMNLVPGGPFLSEKPPSPQVLAALEQKYGLDKPLYRQFFTYVGDAVQGDFGVSFRMQKNRPVLDIVLEMFPTSAKLGVLALVAACGVGIPLGALAAYRKGAFLDNFLRLVTTLGIAVPSFVLATLLLLLFGVRLGLLPTMGLATWQHYILPVFSLSFYPMCYIARLMRASMLDALGQEYMRTAAAKGVPPVKRIFKHALRNSLIPVITYVGPLTAYILAGGFVVESVFSIPGLGRYFIQSLLNRDYPLIMGTTLFLATLLIVMNLLVDLLYRAVDPRISFSGGGQ